MHEQAMLVLGYFEGLNICFSDTYVEQQQQHLSW